MDVQQERAKAFDRYLSPLDIWAMAFGIMVGWGVFAMPGNTFLPVAGPTGTLIAKRKQKRPPMAVFCFGSPGRARTYNPNRGQNIVVAALSLASSLFCPCSVSLHPALRALHSASS